MTDVKAIIRTEDGALVTAANPFPVTGVVTATDLDLRTLTATMDSIAIQGGNTADVKVTMDNEIVGITGNPYVSAAISVATVDSLSGVIDLGANSLVGIMMPTQFTGTTLTFQGALTSAGTYQNIFDDAGIEVQITVAPSRMVSIDLAALKLAPWRFVKVRSGTSSSPTTEAATRTLYVVTK